MSRYFLLLVFCCCSRLCIASGYDSCMSGTANIQFQFSTFYSKSSEPYAYWRDKPLLPEYKIRRKICHANGLLTAGGACLLAAIPLIIAARNNRYADTSLNGRHNIHPPALGYAVGGIFFAGAGIGFTIPGAIIRRKYQRQLALVRR